MIKKFAILIVISGACQLAFASIGNDITKGVEPLAATHKAKNENVTPVDALNQLIVADVEPVSAVEIVKIVYGLTEDCGLTKEIAIAQMTEAGVSVELATSEVIERCGLDGCEQTVAAIDSIVAEALSTLPEGIDTAPLVVMFSGCGIGGIGQQPLIRHFDTGGGTAVSPN